VKTEHLRLREGVPNQAYDPTPYLKVVVVSFQFH